MKNQKRAVLACLATGLMLLTTPGFHALASPGDTVRLPRPGTAAQHISGHSTARPNPAVAAPHLVRYADISGDGLPDLLTVRNIDNELAVHNGTGAADGAGAFAGSTRIGSIASNRKWANQCDLDGDGHNDVASIGSDGNLYFAMNTGTLNGDQTLRPEYVGAAGGWQNVSLVTCVDFVGHDPNDPTTLDGLADLIFRASDDAMYLYVNQGTNAAGVPQFSNAGQLLTGTGVITGLAVADVTHDRFPDLYMTMIDGSVWILDIFAEKDSSGKWQAKYYQLQPKDAADTADTRLLVDVNGDGFVDQVIFHHATGQLTADLHTKLWNPANPGGVFDVANEKTLATGWTSYRLVF
jgi:hypothetical protein